MPTYVYECPICEHQIEVTHKMDEDGPQGCKVCNQGLEPLVRVPQMTQTNKFHQQKGSYNSYGK